MLHRGLRLTSPLACSRCNLFFFPCWCCQILKLGYWLDLLGVELGKKLSIRDIKSWCMQNPIVFIYCIFLWLFFWYLGEVQCEQPNNSLYTFTGNLIIDDQTLPLSPNQLLLRVRIFPFSFPHVYTMSFSSFLSIGRWNLTETLACFVWRVIHVRSSPVGFDLYGLTWSTTNIS